VATDVLFFCQYWDEAKKSEEEVIKSFAQQNEAKKVEEAAKPTMKQKVSPQETRIEN